ncbi:MAG: MBL fold metallo-hydrolase [Actinobacteria bacterium]|nr:MBL fold metallo-hydrolase [Actinomycetota bacterium]
MYFRQVLHEARSCASYVVGCPSLGLCAVIDPQGDPQHYIDDVEGNAMVISHVVDTHVHADHDSGARALAAAANAALYLGGGADVGFEFTPLHDGDVLEIGNRRGRVIHTPGHTPEHVSLFFDDWFLLTGDTLFVGDVGRVDLALTDIDEDEVRSRAKELYESLQTLLSLRDDVEVYPGHYAGSTCGRGMDGKTISTIGRERRTNPALQLDPEQFIDYQIANTPPLPQDFLKIKAANKSSVPAPQGSSSNRSRLQNTRRAKG